MESIKELREICQQYEKIRTDPVMIRIFYRKLSIYVTSVFLRMRITANQISMLGIILGCAGAVLIGSGKAVALIAGIVLLQAGFIFDCVDGEIARYNKVKQEINRANLSGTYLDAIGHLILQPLTVLFFGIGTVHYFPDITIEIILLAFIGAMGVVGIPNIAQSSVIFGYIKSDQEVIKNDEFRHFLSKRISLSERRVNPDMAPKAFPPLDELLIFPGLLVNVTVVITAELILRYFRMAVFASYFRLAVFAILSIAYFFNFLRTFRRNFLHLKNF